MANFVFAKYNSMPEQVEENKENIKKLCGYIKDAYHTNNITLNDTDTTIAISDTNADASTVDGWLFDSIGNLFKITGGDGVNLLIDFYTSFRGEDGAADIDDNTIASNKLWSSQKINSELTNINLTISSGKDKGIYYTLVDPSQQGNQVFYDDVENKNPVISYKLKDLIIYIDGNGKIKDIYEITADSMPVLSVSLIGSIDSGDKLYHNIVGVSNLTWYAGETRNLHVVFDLYLPFKFTDVNSFVSWIDNLTEDTPVFAIGQGWSSGWTSVITMLKPSGQANRVKFDMMSFNHSSLVTDSDILTTTNLSSQTIIIKN